MTLANHAIPDSAVRPGSSEKMEKYDITRVPVDFFHYRNFRYTNLADAIAEAVRDKKSS